MNPRPPLPADILVVDDTIANLQLLAEMLRERGYKPRPVPSGSLALEAARSQPPDLVLLDINMPEMDGYQTCAQLKADTQLRDVPVIFISALNETLDKVRAFGTGGVDYVTKPFQFDEVEARIVTHLRLRQLQRELEQQNALLASQYAELQGNHAKLRELETLRDSLTHMIVHDLRSPLTVVGGYLEVLQIRAAAKLNEGELRYLRQASESCDTLVDMIGSMLDVSRMEAGQMPLQRAPWDLRGPVGELVGKYALMPRVPAVGAELPADLPPLDCDGSLIGRVLANLVGNAVKFTPAAGGKVLIAARREPGGAVRIGVRDNGPGIPPEYHARIFEKFGTAELRAAKVKYSTGLGLAFCKLALEAHGAQIGLSSAPGQGSEFWFVLPAAAT